MVPTLHPPVVLCSCNVGGQAGEEQSRAPPASQLEAMVGTKLAAS